MAEKKSKSLWDAKIIRRALVDALVKLDPRTMMKNPVMFVVEVGSVVTTLLLFRKTDELRLQSTDHAVALVHSAIREFRGSYGGRARQGASRHAA